MAITSDVQELFDRYDMILSDKSIDNLPHAKKTQNICGN